MDNYYCTKCGDEVGLQYTFCSICGTSSFVKKKKIAFICNVCSKQFEKEIEYDNHQNFHPFCSICNKRVNNIKKHEELEHPKCEFCKEHFSSRYKFDEHIRLFHLCQVCNQEFKSKNERDTICIQNVKYVITDL
jgi:DNA-directed RNA polymerase subunit RPC12/RpoP